MYTEVHPASERGQEFEGRFSVPVGLCFTQEHTNERLRFNAFVQSQLDRWVEWRGRRGWTLASEVIVAGPKDPPRFTQTQPFIQAATAAIGQPAGVRAITEFDDADEFKWYFTRARFKQSIPMFVRLEDVMWARDKAATYGINTDVDAPPWTQLAAGKDYIDVEGGLDPMQVAETRRQQLGLKREDFLLGPLSDPL